MNMRDWLMEPNLRINFPSKYTSFVIYYPKCNCECFYCDMEQIFVGCIPFDISSLELSLPFINCLVISGGEPLLAYDDVLQFQQFAKDNNLKIYIYTNGHDLNRIKQLLNNYEDTFIVIDVKGNRPSMIDKTTKTKLGRKIWSTYTKLKNHERIIFRISQNVNNEHNYELIDMLLNVELYETIM